MRRRVVWFVVFSVAMACVESAVVVYLRELYYPDGFRFPLQLVWDRVVAIEIGREAATIVMLMAAGALAGRGCWERFLFFCLGFGVWDIFYYVWLFVFLRWPASLLTWDVLFLIPVPWVAPVLAPVLIATALVIGSAVFLRLATRGRAPHAPFTAWASGVGGALVVVFSFTVDFAAVISGDPPPPFRWGLFATGFVGGVAAAALALRCLRDTR